MTSKCAIRILCIGLVGWLFAIVVIIVMVIGFTFVCLCACVCVCARARVCVYRMALGTNGVVAITTDDHYSK